MARKSVVSLVVALGCVLSTAEAAELGKPPPPPPGMPGLLESGAAAMCANCDEPFDMTTHKRVLEGLVNNPYIAELRKALYVQDILHQFESKAHFDNCDFESSTEYLTSLLEEAGKRVEEAQTAKSAGNAAAMQLAVKSAFFALGQALHGVQDFYAHTNYVELQTPKVKKVTDLEIIAPWRMEGRDRVRQFRGEGLISGFVFWGFPQKCPSGTMSHGDLAKDTANTRSGKQLVAHLQNLNRYRIAVFLAREASLNLMRDAFKRWPMLSEVNGQNVAFEILLDRRGI
jgi:Heterokaryon incompatibility protein Het-C